MTTVQPSELPSESGGGGGSSGSGGGPPTFHQLSSAGGGVGIGSRNGNGGRGLCLGLHHILISLILVTMILFTIVGNILIILSVINYKRMRTFTNVLLVSLASADTLVGLLITPIALVDLLHYHQWPFGAVLCRLWATTDVLLCTASILNLCVISLDRYFAITTPLKYTSTRSWKLAGGVILAVWSVSLVICSPPWFISEWKDKSWSNGPSKTRFEN